MTLMGSGSAETSPPIVASTSSVSWSSWASVTRHLNPEFPAVQYSTVHGVERVFRIAFVIKSDKGEASAFPGESVSRYVDISNFAASFEYTTQIIGRSPVRKIVDLQRYHVFYSRWRRTTCTTTTTTHINFRRERSSSGTTNKITRTIWKCFNFLI